MKLAQREKRLVVAALICVGSFLTYVFMVEPFFESRSKLQRGFVSRQATLKEMLALKNQYEELESHAQRMNKTLASRNKNFSLFSYLDKAAGKAKIKTQIKYMRPSIQKGEGTRNESMVEMKLERITLNQLIDYLYLIESPDQVVAVKRIAVSKDEDESGLLEATLQVLTPL